MVDATSGDAIISHEALPAASAAAAAAPTTVQQVRALLMMHARVTDEEPFVCVVSPSKKLSPSTFWNASSKEDLGFV